MLVQLKNISKSFEVEKVMGRKQIVRAVDDVSLSVTQKQNLGLVGESGSGKTTLGRIMVRLYQPDKGKLFVEGRDITKFSNRKMRSFRHLIQIVFQDPYGSLDPRFTVRGILEEADRMKNAPKNRIERLIACLESVGLTSDTLSRYPHEFSGGERQRIAIARALILNPSLLILDEAVSSLDVLVQEQIIQLLKKLQAEYECTYMFISHNLRVVRKICDRIAVMYKGRIVEVAGTDDLFSNPLHPYTKMLLDAALDYRVQERTDLSFNLDSNSYLIDKGNGHFVIN